MYNYQNILDETFQSLSQTIGIHVMLLIVEHAMVKTKLKYEEASLIKFSEEGISLKNLERLGMEKSSFISHEFIMSLVSTLGHLVGKQLAAQLTKNLITNIETGL